MKADYVLLGVLARQPMSGYDLGKWLESEGLFLGRKASMSPIYRSLADLTTRGWVEAETVQRSAAPEAKVYHLTRRGREALQEWARAPFQPALRPMEPDFIVRLNFAGQFGPDIALQVARTELEYRVAQRARESSPLLRHDFSPIPEIDASWLAEIDFATHSRGWQSTSLYIGWLEVLCSQLASEVERRAVASLAAQDRAAPTAGIAAAGQSFDSAEHESHVGSTSSTPGHHRALKGRSPLT